MLKKIGLKLVLAAGASMVFGAALSLAAGNDWEIDGAHTSASFRIKHMMISTVKGDVSGASGKVIIDDKDLTKSSVEATLEAKTITTNNEKRDEHLRSADFFDVAKYPKITFKSKKVEKAGSKLKVTGDFTMHGVTKEVVLDVEGPTEVVKDPWGNARRGFSATTSLNRKDYGMTWNKSLDGGGIVVGEDLQVELAVEVTQAIPKPAAKK